MKTSKKGSSTRSNKPAERKTVAHKHAIELLLLHQQIAELRAHVVMVHVQFTKLNSIVGQILTQQSRMLTTMAEMAGPAPDDDISGDKPLAH